MAHLLRNVVADGLLRFADWATRAACRLRPDLATRPALPGRAAPAAPALDPMDLAPETPDASDFPPDFPSDAPEHWRELLRGAGRPVPTPPPSAPRPTASGRVIALCPANHRGTPTVTLRPHTQTSPVRPEAGDPSPSSGRTAPGTQSAPPMPGTGHHAGAGNVAGSHAGPTSGAGPNTTAGPGPAGTAGPRPLGSGTEGSHRTGPDAAGSYTAGSETPGSRTLGSETSGSHRSGPGTTASRPLDSETAASRPFGSEANGSHRPGPEAASPRPGSEAAGSRRLGPETVGLRQTGPETTGSRQVGSETAGSSRFALDAASPQATPWASGSPEAAPARGDRTPRATDRPLASGRAPAGNGSDPLRGAFQPASTRHRDAWTDLPADGFSRQTPPQIGLSRTTGTPSDQPRTPEHGRAGTARPVEIARSTTDRPEEADSATTTPSRQPAVSVRPARRPAQATPASRREADPVWPVTDTTPADRPRPAGNWPELLEDTAVSTPDPREERHTARLIAEQEGTPWNA